MTGTPKAITTKELAYALAEQHQLTKKHGQQMLEDLVGLITKHLKNGERVKIAGLGILQVRIVPPASAAIPRRASRFRSRRARKSLSAPPKNSRWQSDQARWSGLARPAFAFAYFGEPDKTKASSPYRSRPEVYGLRPVYGSSTISTQFAPLPTG